MKSELLAVSNVLKLKCLRHLFFARENTVHSLLTPYTLLGKVTQYLYLMCIHVCMHVFVGSSSCACVYRTTAGVILRNVTYILWGWISNHQLGSNVQWAPENLFLPPNMGMTSVQYHGSGDGTQDSVFAREMLYQWSCVSSTQVLMSSGHSFLTQALFQINAFVI